VLAAATSAASPDRHGKTRFRAADPAALSQQRREPPAAPAAFWCSADRELASQMRRVSKAMAAGCAVDRRRVRRRAQGASSASWPPRRPFVATRGVSHLIDRRALSLSGSASMVLDEADLMLDLASSTP